MYLGKKKIYMFQNNPEIHSTTTVNITTNNHLLQKKQIITYMSKYKHASKLKYIYIPVFKKFNYETHGRIL